MHAFRHAASRDPSWERMCREREMVECGKRCVKRVEANALEIVLCISEMRLFPNPPC